MLVKSRAIKIYYRRKRTYVSLETISITLKSHQYLAFANWNLSHTIAPAVSSHGTMLPYSLESYAISFSLKESTGAAIFAPDASLYI